MSDEYADLSDDEAQALLMDESLDDAGLSSRVGRAPWSATPVEMDWRDFNTAVHDPVSAAACRATLFSDDPLIGTFATMIDELRRTYADTDGALDSALAEIFSTLQVFIGELIVRPGPSMVRLLRRHHPEVAADSVADLRLALDEFEKNGYR